MDDFRLISDEEIHKINVDELMVTRTNYDLFLKKIKNLSFFNINKNKNKNKIMNILNEYKFIINEIELLIKSYIFNVDDDCIYTIILNTSNQIDTFIFNYSNKIDINNYENKYYLKDLQNEYDNILFYIELDIFYETIKNKNYFVLYTNLYSHILYIGYLITNNESYIKALTKIFA